MSSPDTGISDKSILRAADIRGVAGLTLSAPTAEAIGRAFGSVVLRKGLRKIFVGGDGRLSTPELSAALIGGLTASGADVVDIGLCPTPMLYFAVFATPETAGVMVTASHNSKEYNGFKMLIDGAPFCGADIDALGRMIDAGDFESGAGSVRREGFLTRYVDRLLTDYNRDGRDLTVVWDCGNATAGAVVPTLVKGLTGRHILLNERIDGNFPAHAPDSSKPENLRELSETVLREKADLGLAFDGDSDRLGVVDSRGKMVGVDNLLPIFAEEILKSHPNAVFIADVKSGKSFSSEIERLGGRPLIWKTGHSFIKRKMRETGAPLGGEMSGHICFADKYFGFDDALYAAIRLLNIAGDRQNAPLQNRIDQIPETFATPEIDIPCPDAEKFAVVEKIKTALTHDGIDFDATDGVKRTFPTTGWWLIRASNTSPNLVCRCESDTKAELEDLKKDIFSTINRVYPIENFNK